VLKDPQASLALFWRHKAHKSKSFSSCIAPP